jgi:hypothetical protein
VGSPHVRVGHRQASKAEIPQFIELRDFFMQQGATAPTMQSYIARSNPSRKHPVTTALRAADNWQ